MNRGGWLQHIFPFALGLLVCVHAQLGMAQPPSVAGEVVSFSETGHEELRRQLHSRAEFRRLLHWTKPPDPPVRERIALVNLARGKQAFALVTYESVFVCGSHGCPLFLLERERGGIWRKRLELVTSATAVGLGPSDANGYRKLVLPGLVTDDSCPVWAHDGVRYDLLGRMPLAEEPCRSLMRSEQGIDGGL